MDRLVVEMKASAAVLLRMTLMMMERSSSVVVVGRFEAGLLPPCYEDASGSYDISL